eukprot:6190931-Pleurochrysis_carterae.AAC.2
MRRAARLRVTSKRGTRGAWIEDEPHQSLGTAHSFTCIARREKGCCGTAKRWRACAARDPISASAESAVQAARRRRSDQHIMPHI